MAIGNSIQERPRQARDSEALAAPVERSLIASDATIIGDVSSEGTVVIAGSVRGNVNAAEVRLERDGLVEGIIFADRVRICGELDGEIRASDVSVGATARIRGKIFHTTMDIEPGAHLDGVRPWRPNLDRHQDSHDGRVMQRS
jgi:cytoskeletal protein CcmA (bactofilin family)